MIAGGFEVIGGGIMVASSAVAGGAWMRRHRTVAPWRLEFDGATWRATNRTGEPTMELRIKVDDVDVRGIGLSEDVQVGIEESVTFSTTPMAAPEFDPAAVDLRDGQVERTVEVSWKYEFGGRRYYWSNRAESGRHYYWAKGPGGQWG